MRGTASDYGVSIQSNAAMTLIRLGRSREAREILRDAESRNPSEIADADLRLTQARLEVCSGAFAEAAAHIGTVRRMTNALDPPYDAPLRAMEAEIALWQRRPGDALTTIAAGLEQRRQSVAGRPTRVARAVGAGRRGGRPAAATALGDSHERRCAGRGRPAGAGPRLPGRGAASGRRDARVCGAMRGRSGACLTGWRGGAVGRGRRCVGLPQAALPRGVRTVAPSRGAARSPPGSRWVGGPPPRVRAAGRLGADHLRRELAMLAQRARIELPPASDDATDAPANNRTGLTARQLEVLALIAQGQTNREIAETLFITEKTAGAHVSSILARLGVRSRVEAATTAHRLGIARPQVAD